MGPIFLALPCFTRLLGDPLQVAITRVPVGRRIKASCLSLILGFEFFTACSESVCYKVELHNGKYGPQKLDSSEIRSSQLTSSSSDSVLLTFASASLPIAALDLLFHMLTLR